MKKIFLLLPLLTAGLFCTGVLAGEFEDLRSKTASKYKGMEPKEWAENLPGVHTKFKADGYALALTFDACGSKNDGFDEALIDFLIKEKVPATLFINARWIDKYPEHFKKISQCGNFEIENHGLQHKPCSSNGRSVYGIDGTKTPEEIVDEIELNGRKIEKLTGRKPSYYRSGTAYYDEIGISIASDLGYKIGGFAVLGDAGASYSKEKVKEVLLNAPSGSIVIMHMNHPEKQTGEGVISAVPELKKRGVRFVKLQDVVTE